MTVPDDDDLFHEAMKGVKPIERPGRVRVSRDVSPRLVAKDRPTFTVEGDVGFTHGVSRRQLSQLRSGKLPVETTMDLHRQTAEVARDTVARRVLEAAQAGVRRVLIIHGRGAVLREVAIETLTRGSLAHLVLAYCPARPRDGGAGALYVLLRRG